jgi:hypothetical protein
VIPKVGFAVIAKVVCVLLDRNSRRRRVGVAVRTNKMLWRRFEEADPIVGDFLIRVWCVNALG